MIDKTLKTYIEQKIIPRYEKFDSAHNIDHVTAVINESLRLATEYNVNHNVAYTVAAYHDTGLCRGRELHHIYSAEIILSDNNLREWFSEEQIETIAQAAKEHRASATCEPQTIYGKIVAEADRIIDPEITLRRTIQYGLANYPQLSRDEQYIRFVNHLQEKYAEGGYLKLYLDKSSNAQRLSELRKIISSPEELKRRFFKEWSELVGL